ncbi:MAG TPA: hypothetical protein DCE42_25735 [Myxococcales bacterium]|nr:hypothetical protein [Myxococcales bacterium]
MHLFRHTSACGDYTRERPMAKQSKQPNFLWSILILLVLAGTAASGYLAWLHYKVYTDTAYQSSCNFGKGLNCESVAKSSYALLVGMPVASWGILGYLIILFVLLTGLNPKKRSAPLYGGLSLLLLASFGMSAAYAIISKVIIGSMCLYCMVTYGINLLLPILFFFEVKQPEYNVFETIGEYLGWQMKNISVLVILGFITIGGISMYPKYWKTEVAPKPQASTGTSLNSGYEDGHFWIGAEKPLITLVEFADYECGYCKFFHARVRKLVRKYPNKIRLFHRHFPLDKQCNPGGFHKHACMFSYAAHCAGQQGKFWEVNDILYQEGGRSIKSREAMLARLKSVKFNFSHFQSCLDNPATKAAIKLDVNEGLRRKLRGTPYFYLNGRQLKQSEMKKFEQTIITAVENATRAAEAKKAAAPRTPPRAPAPTKAKTPARTAPTPKRTTNTPTPKRATSAPAPKR